MLQLSPKGIERQELANPSSKTLAQRMHEALLAHYGVPEPKVQRDPLSELVVTILSQNTSDTNTARAYAELRQTFGDWEQVRLAPTEAVADAIRVGGLANVKAPRIKRILDDLHKERGELSLAFLEDLETEEARRYLEELPGVGPKTAACVLLFSLQKPALPVDTHVHRVTMRVGLLPNGTSAAKAHLLLEDLLPQEAYYPFHLNVIRHGRTICHAQNPECDVCPIADLCAYYAEKHNETAGSSSA
ncbi:MAG: endonuclease III domain-containing protein [Anaerolineae bacterium]